MRKPSSALIQCFFCKIPSPPKKASKVTIGSKYNETKIIQSSYFLHPKFVESSILFLLPILALKKKNIIHNWTIPIIPPCYLVRVVMLSKQKLLCIFLAEAKPIHHPSIESNRWGVGPPLPPASQKFRWYNLPFRATSKWPSHRKNGGFPWGFFWLLIWVLNQK